MLIKENGFQRFPILYFSAMKMIVLCFIIRIEGYEHFGNLRIGRLSSHLNYQIIILNLKKVPFQIIFFFYRGFLILRQSSGIKSKYSLNFISIFSIPGYNFKIYIIKEGYILYFRNNFNVITMFFKLIII